MLSNFKIGYSMEEARAAPQFDRKLTCKVGIETKHEPVAVLGISKVGFIKDAVANRRGRQSHYSNDMTYGSQVRYLPGSKKDAEEVVIPISSIRIGKFK
jgi:hypothetical protein